MKDKGAAAGLSAQALGTVHGDHILLHEEETQFANVQLTDLRAAHESFFKDWMEQ